MSAERQWSELLPRLTDSRRRVLTVDLPGHGHSVPIEAREARPSVIAAALAALIEAEDGPVDVVGYSLGARLAWELPGVTTQVRRLVLCGLAPFEPLADLNLDAIRATVAGSPATDPMPDLFAQIVTAPGNSAESLIAAIEGLRSEPFTPVTGFMTATLIVIGNDDESAAGSAAFTELLPNARVEWVPGDHPTVPFEPAFGDAVLRFLDGGEGQRASNGQTSFAPKEIQR